MEAPWLTLSYVLNSFFSREGDGLYLLGWSGHYGGLPCGKKHDKWFILCRRTEVTASGHCEEKKRKVDSRCSVLAR